MRNSNRYDEYDTENIGWAILRTLGTIVIVGFFIYKIVQYNNETEALNKITEIHNQKQKEIINKLFNDDKKKETLEWIKSNIDSKNQPIFNKFVENTHRLVLEGTDELSKFVTIDTEMTNSIFCIQGKKDIDNFEVFQSKLYETEELKQYLVALKKKYGYDNMKTTIPSEEEVLEFCDFKDFEKDLKSTGNKSIIEEKLPEESEE